MTLMHDQTMLTDTIAPAATEVRWPMVTLFAFRLWFVYFGLYVITTQMISSMVRLPVAGIPRLSVGDSPH